MPLGMPAHRRAQQNADVAISEHIVRRRMIDIIGDAARKRHALYGGRIREGLAVVGIEKAVLVRLRLQMQRLRQMVGHPFADRRQPGRIGRVAHGDLHAVRPDQPPDRFKYIGDPALLHFDQAAADIQAADAAQRALLIEREVGGAAAHVDVGHRRARFLGNLIGSRAAGGKHAFQIRPGGRDHEIARQIGQRRQDLIGVMLARRFAGDDDRAGLKILRLHAGPGVFVADDLLDRFGVDLGGRQQRRKIDLAAVDHFLIDNADAGHRVAARQIFHNQLAEHQLRGRGSDIDADAVDAFLHGAHQPFFSVKTG